MRKFNLTDEGFQLSWSYYLKLIQLLDVEERSFYEIVNSNWSVRELDRQCNSALYQRLVLSRDKGGVKELAEKRQIIVKPQDIFKDSYVLEFVGLPENKKYSESQLEQNIIDKLEDFYSNLEKDLLL